METTRVKICGLTNLEDTLAAIEMGADYLGFNFYPESPRFLEFEEAERIIEEVPPNIFKVGVFVNADYQTLVDYAQFLNLDLIQFHGDESVEFCQQMARPWMKAIRLDSEADLEKISLYPSEWILLDSYVPGQYGGTGLKPNWEIASRAKDYGKKVFLAGGLKPENVQLAIATVQPYAVDVASGVEKVPGRKDLAKMEEFITKAKAVHLRIV